jgi:hypothetical protein
MELRTLAYCYGFLPTIARGNPQGPWHAAWPEGKSHKEFGSVHHFWRLRPGCHRRRLIRATTGNYQTANVEQAPVWEPAFVSWFDMDFVWADSRQCEPVFVWELDELEPAKDSLKALQAEPQSQVSVGM